MYRPNPFSNSTLHFPNSIGWWPLRRGLSAVLLAHALFALSLAAQAVTPAPDGGYPGRNTAEGDNALFSLTSTAHNNTAVGAGALFGNTTGDNNTASGASALYHNTTGIDNTASGVLALSSNSNGRGNTATGAQALNSNTGGDENTATGRFALFSNTTGLGNSAHGLSALQNNTSGTQNTANGYQALGSNTTGSFNIALGRRAGVNLTAGDNNIDIGNTGVAGDSATIRIGNKPDHSSIYIAGIYGKTAASGVGVIINTSGQLGTIQSAARFKDNIKPMDKTSEAILKLEPVTFHYKQELDPDGIQQFGLIAEQVEKVNPALVVRDEDGKLTTVRYEAVNAMLLNEFLKEHRRVAEQQAKVTEQQSTIAELKTTVAQQQKQIEALTATVQKVSDQIALSKPAPQLVANP